MSGATETNVEANPVAKATAERITTEKSSVAMGLFHTADTQMVPASETTGGQSIPVTAPTATPLK